MRSHTARDREGLLVHRLPRSAAVLDVSASVVLRHFVGGSASDWVGLSEVLTAEQEAEIATSERPTPAWSGAVALEPADYAMLDVLSARRTRRYRAAGACRRPDRGPCRAPPGRAGRQRAWSTSTSILPRRCSASRVSAYLWLTVAPAELDAACRALATHPEAPFVAAVSGQANVVVSVTCRDLDELYRYTTDRLGVIAGVQAVEVSPMLRRLKQAGALVDGDRLAVG